VDEFLPLTTFDGATTRVDLDRLTPFERVLFDLVFPGFSETPDYNKNARAALERGLAPQTPYNYRRFAGGPDLPRGSYSAVGSSSGDATNILLHELLFYTDPKIIVGFHVVTGRHSWLETGAESPMGRFTDFRPDPSSVLVLFHSSPGLHPLFVPFSSPISDKASIVEYVKTAQISSTGVLAFPIPVTSTTVQIPDVLDLRRPESQRFMNA
jgi:hypothetical protein